MRSPILLVILAAVAVAALAPYAQADIVTVAPPGSNVPDAVTDLDALFATLPEGSVVQFTPGRYELLPKPYLEDLCGNCPEESTQVVATVGLRITGRGIWLLGPIDGEAVIVTNAGYGLLFDDCRSCNMEGLTVTGGVRDSSANATDAGVVVKRSSVSITNCVIRDNIGDPAMVAKTVVGIMGIAGREGSVMTIRNNSIIRNSWDGIGLYRHAQATIEGNLIDGIDLARGRELGGGRGVGIGCTWNAFARITGNLIRHYWKGIGIFVDAQATVEENVVEHVATWGISLWDAGSGRPTGNIRRNVIYDTGACGVSVVRTSPDSPPPGQFVQNILVRTGQDPRYDSGEPYCFQTALARHAVPDNFPVSANIHYLNRETRGDPGKEDVGRDDFRTRVKVVLEKLERWPRFAESDFQNDFIRPLREEAEAEARAAAAVADSLRALADSLAAPEGTAVDSLVTPPPDSLEMAPADTSAAPDSTTGG